MLNSNNIHIWHSILKQTLKPKPTTQRHSDLQRISQTSILQAKKSKRTTPQFYYDLQIKMY